MKIAAIFRKFSKWALAAAIVTVSTAIFAFWWIFLYDKDGKQPKPPAPQIETNRDSDIELDWELAGPDPAELRRKKAATLAERIGRLFVADGDLYDAENGELIFENWLGGERPLKLFYEPTSRRIMGRFERGFTSFNLDGSKAATLAEPSGLAFSKDFREAVFAKNGDVQIAEVDWPAMRLTNERQVTKLGSVTDPFFLQNMLLMSDRYLLLRIRQQAVRVGLADGEVQSVDLPPASINRGRSPDARLFAAQLRGRAGNTIGVYDLERNSSLQHPIGRNAVVDLAWINSSRCVFLTGGDEVVLYDKAKDAFERICTLPKDRQKFSAPSPDGKIIMAGGRTGGEVIDLATRKVTSFDVIGPGFEWISPGALIITDDVPDSSRRGTWFKVLGEAAQRLTGEPYLENDSLSALAILPGPGWAVFCTKNALFRVGTDGEGFKEIATKDGGAMHLFPIEAWPPAVE